MAPSISTIDIVDLSRGISDWYPPRLDPDQVATAWNVEFFDGAVCGRRPGSVAVVSGGTPAAPQGRLFVHTPTTDPANDRLVRSAGSPGVITLYDHAYAPTVPPIVPADNFNFIDFPTDYATLHGKLFIAAKSAVDRLHVYDGTVVRRTGLTAPIAASFTVANQGSGSFTGVRQYRIRFVATVGGVVTRRSEPSPAKTFTPTGPPLAARITVDGGVADPGTTGAEIEEIAPDATWYRIGTIAFPVNFYDDTLALSAVATSGVQSGDVGDYTLQYSAQWLTVDEDRLLLGGAYEQQALSGRVSWTPLGSAVGAGNDERLPSDVEGFIDFDTLDGGGLTGIKAWEGKVIVFKAGQVHQMVRSSSRLRAYLPDCLSRRHGAIPGSIVEGTDVDGLSCLYFLDRQVGPMQLGFRGLRVLLPQLLRTWQDTVNFAAVQVACAGYHAEKRQVWWHVAMDAETKPSRRWMYSVETDGLVFHTVPNVVRSVVAWNDKPHMLLDNPGGIVIVEGDLPAVLTDYGTLYRAYVRTRGYQQGGLLRRWGVLSGVLEASALAGVSVNVIPVRDYGIEDRPIPVPLDALSGEPFVAKPIDNLYLIEALTLQFEIGDVVAVAVEPWQIHGLSLAYQLGSASTGRG